MATRTWQLVPRPLRRHRQAAGHGEELRPFPLLDDLPLEVIGETIAKVPLDAYVAHYQAARGSSRKIKRTAEG